jgi:hypothetical protein
MVIVESIIRTTMAKQVKSFLGSFGLINKVIAFVKDKRTNLGTMTTILKNVVLFALLNLPTPFFGTF